MAMMLFYVAAGVALLSAVLVITRAHASHALIYLIVTLLALAVIFYLLGAPFASALAVVVYAGAIMVLFLFVVMMLNLGRAAAQRERLWLRPAAWIGPGALTFVLLIEMGYLIADTGVRTSGTGVPPEEVGMALYGPYLLVVELAAVVLLAALIGAYHLGRRQLRGRRREAEV